MKLRFAYLLMNSPAWLWRHYPSALTGWCVDQHMLTFESVRRLLSDKEVNHPRCTSCGNPTERSGNNWVCNRCGLQWPTP